MNKIMKYVLVEDQALVPQYISDRGNMFKIESGCARDLLSVQLALQTRMDDMCSVFYKHNTFRFDSLRDMLHYLVAIDPCRAKLIRYLVVDDGYDEDSIEWHIGDGSCGGVTNPHLYKDAWLSWININSHAVRFISKMPDLRDVALYIRSPDLFPTDWEELDDDDACDCYSTCLNKLMAMAEDPLDRTVLMNLPQFSVKVEFPQGNLVDLVGPDARNLASRAALRLNSNMSKSHLLASTKKAISVLWEHKQKTNSSEWRSVIADRVTEHDMEKAIRCLKLDYPGITRQGPQRNIAGDPGLSPAHSTRFRCLPPRPDGTKPAAKRYHGL